MEKRFFLFLVFLFPLAGLAEPLEVVTVNNLRYSQETASAALSPEAYLQLSFGREPANIGGVEQDEQHRTDGVPFGFIPAADGSVWILDTINQSVKQFAKDGKLLAAIPFATHGTSGPPVVRDFSPGPDGTFYLLCSTDGKVEQIDAKGRTLLEIEGLRDTLMIGTDPKGNILVLNPVMGGLFRFDATGKLVQSFKNPDELSVFTDAEGNPYGIRGEEAAVTIFKLSEKANPQETVLAKIDLDTPPDRKARFAGQNILGTDSGGNLYVRLVAMDNDGVIHLNRLYKLSPQGKILAKTEFLAQSFMAVDVQKRFAVMPDGRIMGFAVDGNHYSLTSLKF